MDSFEYISVLISILLGLAVTVLFWQLYYAVTIVTDIV